MGYLLASAAISFAVALFFVRQAGNGVTWGSDSDFDGPQKFHRRAVPRVRPRNSASPANWSPSHSRATKSGVCDS